MLVGASMGSLGPQAMAEDPISPFDGYVALGAMGGGLTQTVDFFLAIQIAMEAVGLWNPSWGVPGNVRNDIDFETEVLPTAEALNPDADPRIEFVRRVLGAPASWFEAGEYVALEEPYAAAIPSARISHFVIQMAIITDLAGDWEARFGEGGQQNLDHNYQLSATDRADLASRGLAEPVIDSFLSRMNATRVTPQNPARDTFASFNPTGQLTRPMLTVRSMSDGVILPYHDTLYRKTVAASESSGLLSQNCVAQTTHIQNFTPDQIADAVGAMVGWVENGTSPRPDDATRFPPYHAWTPCAALLPPLDADLDRDGALNSEDNRPLVANGDQADRGGINTTTPDGIGDACQCGDVTGNGVVNGQDGNAIRRHGLGAEPNPTFAVPGNCDVTGNGLCNGQDGNAVRSVALGADNPLFGQHCQNADYAAAPCTNCE